jgi:hypothetical protein
MKIPHGRGEIFLSSVAPSGERKASDDTNDGNTHPAVTWLRVTGE